MKKLFLVIGAPGSGKTTDAQNIASRNNNLIVHYSTGDLLRSEVAKETELGKTIDLYTSRGNLVPLHIVINTIVKAIKEAERDIIIIDGYPRSVEQMLALDDVLAREEKVELVQVIEVVVSEEVAMKRVLGRGRGGDDNVEVFKNRMQVYLEPLEEIERFYNNMGILKRVNGHREIVEIVDEIEELIKGMSSNLK